MVYVYIDIEIYICHHQPYHQPSSNSTLNNELADVSDTFITRMCAIIVITCLKTGECF